MHVAGFSLFWIYFYLTRIKELPKINFDIEHDKIAIFAKLIILREIVSKL